MRVESTVRPVPDQVAMQVRSCDPRRTTEGIQSRSTAWVESDRPRERLLEGKTLTDSELLAILLRTGNGETSAVGLARDIFKRFGSVANLESATPAQLCEVKGIGPAKAAEIIAALQLGRRAAEEHARARDRQPQINTSSDVAEMFRHRMRGMTQEEFVLLCLNTKNKVTREVMISRGTLNASMVHPRDVFKNALDHSAAAVVFVHNHPSGDPRPSGEDRSLTSRLSDCGKLLGIRVLDHVIVGADTHYSFADEGELG